MSKAIIAIDKSKSYRVYITITTDMVQKAADIHDTTPMAAAGLGRVLTAAGLMGIMMKNDNEKLEISNKFLWNNIEEDPFFHSIGKYDTDPKGNKVFYDYSVDATVLAKRPNGEKYFPVILSIGLFME